MSSSLQSAVDFVVEDIQSAKDVDRKTAIKLLARALDSTLVRAEIMDQADFYLTEAPEDDGSENGEDADITAFKSPGERR